MSARRIAVVGLPGSGKSTLARRIGERLSLPVIHLDAHFFLPDWKPRPEDEWAGLAEQLVEGDAWVMDGAFAMDLALRRADTIVHLDFPRWRGLLGSVKRNLTGRRSPPADFAPGCREHFDRQFLQLLRYVWRYPREEHTAVVTALSASRRGVERALEALAGPPRITAIRAGEGPGDVADDVDRHLAETCFGALDSPQ